MADMKPTKLKNFGWSPRSKLLAYLMQTGVVILAINWVFQGVRGMQFKELSFRWALESIVFLILFLILIQSEVSVIWSCLGALVLAHSLNWLFNTHLWVCVRYMKVYRRNPDALSNFLSDVSKQINKKSWLKEAVCIGSIGDKGDVSSWRSDIDLRLFFGAGPLDYFRLNFYLIYLRTRALIEIIPLDLYAYDNIEILERFKSDEGILLIKDVDGRIAARFSGRVSNDYV